MLVIILVIALILLSIPVGMILHKKLLEIKALYVFLQLNGNYNASFFSFIQKCISPNYFVKKYKIIDDTMHIIVACVIIKLKRKERELQYITAVVNTEYFPLYLFKQALLRYENELLFLEFPTYSIVFEVNTKNKEIVEMLNSMNYKQILRSPLSNTIRLNGMEIPKIAKFIKTIEDCNTISQ